MKALLRDHGATLQLPRWLAALRKGRVRLEITELPVKRWTQESTGGRGIDDHALFFNHLFWGEKNSSFFFQIRGGREMGPHFFLEGGINTTQMYSNFEGFFLKITVHCLGWCHIMTPVQEVFSYGNGGTPRMVPLNPPSKRSTVYTQDIPILYKVYMGWIIEGAIPRVPPISTNFPMIFGMMNVIISLFLSFRWWVLWLTIGLGFAHYDVPKTWWLKSPKMILVETTPIWMRFWPFIWLNMQQIWEVHAANLRGTLPRKIRRWKLKISEKIICCFWKGNVIFNSIILGFYDVSFRVLVSYLGWWIWWSFPTFFNTWDWINLYTLYTHKHIQEHSHHELKTNEGFGCTNRCPKIQWKTYRWCFRSPKANHRNKPCK